ncbi:MAG: PQQ-dependent sugar dehydrogenase [Burkholderiales bacterium]|nr:PQQ-dependent sugar dehydrogenase [Burkholderiales bacterium]
MSARSCSALSTCCLVVGLGAAAPAAAYSLQEVAAALDRPLFVTAPAGDDRLFVVGRGGVITAIDRAAGTQSSFLDISARVSSLEGERGLLGLAFDPQFGSNGHFYVNYTDVDTGHTIIERYTATPDRALGDPDSVHRLMTIEQPVQHANHKGGWIGFRPGEGDNLYIATGDGGGSGDPLGSGQNVNTNLGKILRIGVRGDDFAGDDGRNYTIPGTNPYAGATAGNDEIWAIGLRNPFRNSFDRETGDFWIADVGQDAREEVNVVLADAADGERNFGWNIREGTVGGAVPNSIDPVYEYAHDGSGASITGGHVYRGPIEALQGTYFFGDFVRGTVGSFRLVDGAVTELTDWTPVVVEAGISSIASFGEDAAGNLYVVDYGGTVAVLVPEPQTWALLGAGIALLGFVVRRRRR